MRRLKPRPSNLDVRIVLYHARRPDINPAQEVNILFMHDTIDLFEFAPDAKKYLQVIPGAPQMSEYASRLYFRVCEPTILSMSQGRAKRRVVGETLVAKVCNTALDDEKLLHFTSNIDMIEPWLGGMYALKWDEQRNMYYVDANLRQPDTMCWNKKSKKKEVTKVPEVFENKTPAEAAEPTLDDKQRQIRGMVKKFTLQKMIEAVRNKDIVAANLWLDEYEDKNRNKVLIND